MRSNLIEYPEHVLMQFNYILLGLHDFISTLTSRGYTLYGYCSPHTTPLDKRRGRGQRLQ